MTETKPDTFVFTTHVSLSRMYTEMRRVIKMLTAHAYVNVFNVCVDKKNEFVRITGTYLDSGERFTYLMLMRKSETMRKDVGTKEDRIKSLLSRGILQHEIAAILNVSFYMIAAAKNRNTVKVPHYPN